MEHTRVHIYVHVHIYICMDTYVSINQPVAGVYAIGLDRWVEMSVTWGIIVRDRGTAGSNSHLSFCHGNVQVYSRSTDIYRVASARTHAYSWEPSTLANTPETAESPLPPRPDGVVVRSRDRVCSCQRAGITSRSCGCNPRDRDTLFFFFYFSIRLPPPPSPRPRPPALFPVKKISQREMPASLARSCPRQKGGILFRPVVVSAARVVLAMPATNALLMRSRSHPVRGAPRAHEKYSPPSLPCRRSNYTVGKDIFTCKTYSAYAYSYARGAYRADYFLPCNPDYLEFTSG